MKKRCAGLAVVLVSLVAVDIAAATDFHGVIYPDGWSMYGDSVRISPHDTTFITPNWGGTVDTFDFPDLLNWPTNIVLYGHTGVGPNITTIPNPVIGHWYNIQTGGDGALVMFYGADGVEERRLAVESQQHMLVSPSVVTGQMTVRLQPAGPGRPVVDIHDAVGNVVRSLDCATGADGVATATWNREDDHGRLAPEGVYFCRYAAAGVIAVRKILVAH